MNPRVLLLAAAFIVAPTAAARSQPYQLTSVTFGSAGSTSQGSPYQLGMTVGQSVTGMGTGPAVPIYAELAGFWRWGHVPVLEVPGDEDPAAPVMRFALEANTPNPFGRSTMIRYAVPTSMGPNTVEVRVIDLSGRVIRVLDSGTREPGVHSVAWDGRGVNGSPVESGVYFYQMRAGAFLATRRMVLIR